MRSNPASLNAERKHPMKYTISSPASVRSALAQAYVGLLADGKAGDLLVKNGFSQSNFATFLARYASRAIAAKHTPEQLAETFRAIGAGNASQVRQALADLVIIIDDGKPQSLSAYWGTGDAKPDTSKIAAL